MAREAKFSFISEDHIKNKPRHDGIEYRVSLLRNVTKSKEGGGG